MDGSGAAEPLKKGPVGLDVTLFRQFAFQTQGFVNKW